MNIPYPIKPIGIWPRKLTAERRFSPFRSTFEATMDLLETELNYLDATNIVVQLAVRQEDIRLDGTLRTARDTKNALHPGVIVSFDSDRGPLSFACDAFQHQTDNMRGIAMTLERLRKVDLYGVTQTGEQYKGWAALPAPIGEITTVADAVDFLARQAGIVIDPVRPDPEVVKTAYRKCLRTLHPDAGGDAELFRKLQAAYALLNR